MRRKLLSAVLIFSLILAIFTRYFTGSWFLSSSTGNRNTIRSGRLEISGPGSITDGMLDIDDVYPGWYGSRAIEIANTGNVGFEYRMSIESKNLIGNPLYDGDQPLQIKILRGDAVLKEYENINALGFVEMGLVSPGSSDFLTLCLRLPEESDDSCQGRSVDIGFVFEAKQAKEDSFYPTAKYITSISVCGEGGSVFLGDHGGTMRMHAVAQPADATDKRIAWSVQSETGNASIDDSGLLTALSNGTVTVRASSMDGSGVSGQAVITIRNIADAANEKELQSQLNTGDTASLNLKPGIYNFKEGISCDRDIQLYCGRGRAIVNIVKYDGGKDTGFGSKPNGITAGAGVEIYEDIAFVNLGYPIQTAVNKVPDNGVVYVDSGTYAGNIQINKPVILLGSGAISGFAIDEESLMLTPSTASKIVYKGSAGPGINLTGAGIANVTIRGFLFSGINGDGITCSASGPNAELNNVRLENNGFESIDKDFIDFANVKRTGVVIRRNAFCEKTASKKTVVNLAGSSNRATSIDGNLISFRTNSNSSDGIGVSGADGVCISNNTIVNSGGNAISVNNTGNSIQCIGNDITGAYAGIAFLPSGGAGIKSINIYNNNIKDAKRAGIYAFDAVSSSGNLTIGHNSVNQDAGKITAAYSAIYLRTDEGVGKTADVSGNAVSIYGTGRCDINGIYILSGPNKLNIHDNRLRNTAASTYDADICGIYIDPVSSADVIDGLSRNTIEGFARPVYDGRDRTK